MAAYEQAVETLYRAPFGEFVNQRKRLAAELKAAGDKEGATRLGKLARPPASAWAVNQLWWNHREDFEQLVDAAARVKAGDRNAGKEHRERLAQLGRRAALLLQEAGNAATEATLRRVTTTLSAIAAQGDFAPEAPGMLAADRDPPGFEALGSWSAPSGPTETAAAPREPAPSVADERRARAEQRRLEAEQRRAEEEERKRRLAERERLSRSLREARSQEASQRRELERLREEARSVEQALAETQALLERLERDLASL